MNTMECFIRGQLNKDKPPKVFDWIKAATLIKNSNDKNPIRAGLQEDWFWTGCCIFEEGKPKVESYGFLSSTWATPIIIIDEEEIPCWVWEKDTQWGHSTKWPPEALAILGVNPYYEI